MEHAHSTMSMTSSLCLPKRLPIAEMKYPKSKNPKPVYFLLKLYRMSDYGILSRNLYWLHLPGGDYKLLEPYRTKKIPLKISSNIISKGSTYEVRMQVENTSKKPNPQNQLQENNFYPRIIHRICKHLSRENNSLRAVETNAADVGVAFFLHFLVHASKEEDKDGEDTRILPVHYSDNYFSLVPGEMMSISITFEVPPGATPQIILNGWNYLTVL